MDIVVRGWQTLVDGSTASQIILLLLRLTLVGATGHVVLALMRRASAAARHFAAMVTLALMMATPWLSLAHGPLLRIPVPESADRAPSKWRAHEIYENPATQSVRYSITPMESVAPDRHAGPTPDRTAPSHRSPARSWPAWTTMLAVAAALGAWTLLSLRLLSLASTAWIARRAHAIDDRRLLALFARAAESIGLERTVAFKVTDRLDVPAVTCFVHPVLLLPAEALEWSDARLRAVLLHELAHVRRRDEIGLGLARLATVVLWFHPLAWTLARAARHECERACDDAVLLAGVRPSEYADHLLAIARGTVRSRQSAMALAFARPSSLEGRLLSILRPDARRAPMSRRLALLVTCALAALIVPMAVVRVVAEPGPAKALPSAPSETTTRISNTRTVTSTHEAFAYSEKTKSSQPAPGSDVAAGQEGNELGPAEARSGSEWYAQASSEYDAHHYALAGEAYERAAKAGEKTGKAWYNAACCWALEGQNNRALGALNESMQNGFDAASLMKSDTDLNAVRSDRRFQMLLEAAQYEGISSKKLEKDDGGNDESFDPDDPQQLHSAAMNLMRTGRARQAAELFAKEYAIDSLATSLYNTACAWSIAGRADQSLDMLEQSIYAGYGDRDKFEGDDDLANVRSEPRFAQLCDLVDELDLQFPDGKHNSRDAEIDAWQKMLPHYERVTRNHPRVGRAWFNLGYAALRAGEPQEAREANLQALAVGYRRGTTNYNLACAAAQLGDENEALRRLEMAKAAGMDVASIASGDDDLEPLRHNPEFREITRRDYDGLIEKIKNHSAKWKKKDAGTDG